MYLWLETNIVIESMRTKVLARKYGSRWRKLTWHNKLHRRAKIRRQAYADFWKEEKEKKIREEKREKELAEILLAQKEKEIVQTEQRQAQMEKEERQNEKARLSQEMLYGSSVMSRKRKSMGNEPVYDAHQEETPRKVLRAHRRSRTVGGTENLSPPQTHTPRNLPPGRRISIFSGKESQFGKVVSSPPTNRLNKTRTDYFRMKSYGLDPNAPIIPHTAASLAKKEKREAAENEAALDALYARTRMKRAKAPDPPPSPKIGSFLASLDVPRPRLLIDNTEAFSAIEEMKAMLAESTEWYKEQSAILKEECKQSEEIMRKSASSYSSIYSPRPSASGLAIAPTGYEYRPDNTPPGKPLNRTEMRIRMTGAHGMATAPIGGTPGYTPKRIARVNALRHNLIQEAQEVKTNGVAKKDQKVDLMDKPFRYADDEGVDDAVFTAVQGCRFRDSNGSFSQEGDHSKGAVARETEKPPTAPRHTISLTDGLFKPVNGSATNSFAALSNVEDDSDLFEEAEDEEGAEGDDELLEEEEEELEEEEQDDHQPQLLYESRFDGDTEEAFDDDEVEDEDDEDGDENDEVEDINQIAAHAYLRLPGGERQGSFGGSQMSRGTSGTGASAEDALVLDSD